MIVVVILFRLMSYYFLHNIFFLIKHTLCTSISPQLSFPHISLIPNPIQHLQAVTYSLAKLVRNDTIIEFYSLSSSSIYILIYVFSYTSANILKE